MGCSESDYQSINTHEKDKWDKHRILPREQPVWRGPHHQWNDDLETQTKIGQFHFCFKWIMLYLLGGSLTEQLKRSSQTISFPFLPFLSAVLMRRVSYSQDCLPVVFLASKNLFLMSLICFSLLHFILCLRLDYEGLNWNFP